MKCEIETLEKKRDALDQKIDEVKKRLPAHSTRPQIMMELLDLEDERDLVDKRIEGLKRRGS
jgi:hypothetical protein